MKKILFISSIILSGGLFMAGQSIGQFKPTLPQQEQSERSGAEINSAEGSLSTDQTESDTRQDPADDQQSGFISGTGQQRLQDTDRQRFDQRSPQQQIPLQQQFGLSPRFDSRDDIDSRQQRTQDRREDQPGGLSDRTREQGSSAIQGPGQGQGQSGSSMQSGPSGGGQGGSGGSSGSGGSGGQ